MPDHMFDKKKQRSETQRGKESAHPARRNLLFGSGALLLGGVAGRASVAQETSSEAGAVGKAPDLPWKWAMIDPQEAGSRTYKAYLNQGG